MGGGWGNSGNGWLLGRAVTGQGGIGSAACAGSGWVGSMPGGFVGTQVIEEFVATFVGGIVVGAGVAEAVGSVTTSEATEVTNGKVAHECIAIAEDGSRVIEAIGFGDDR